MAPRRFWLIHLGELLPVDGAVRLYRNSFLAQHLHAAGHEVLQWAPTFAHQLKLQRSGTGARVAERHRIRLIPSRSYRRNIGWDRIRFHSECATRFRAMAREEAARPDLILCGMPTPGMCVVATDLGRTFGVPVILDVRDLWPEAIVESAPAAVRPAAMVYAAKVRCANRRSFAQAAGVTAISEVFLDWGLNFAGRTRGPDDAVFPMGFTPREPTEAERNEAARQWRARGVDGTAPVVAFAGTISRQFDFEWVLRVARALELRAPNVKMVICGSGDLVDNLRRRAGPNVLFPGWVTVPELHVLFGWSRAALAPYRDNVPNAASITNKPFEYMASGVPVLSSKGGDLRALIEREGGGVNIDAGDDEALTDAVARLVTDDAWWQAKSSEARRIAADNSGDRIYQRFATHLERAAQRQPV